MTIFEELGITYEEKDGFFYPNISTETENVNVGKYGLIWMEYMKENAPDRYRSLLRFGRLKKKASEVNEEASGAGKDGSRGSSIISYCLSLLLIQKKY